MLLLSCLRDLLMVKDKKQLTVFLAQQLKDRLTSFLLFVHPPFSWTKKTKPWKELVCFVWPNWAQKLSLKRLTLMRMNHPRIQKLPLDYAILCTVSSNSKVSIVADPTGKSRSCLKNSSVGLDQRWVWFQAMLLGVARIKGSPGMAEHGGLVT